MDPVTISLGWAALLGVAKLVTKLTDNKTDDEIVAKAGSIGPNQLVNVAADVTGRIASLGFMKSKPLSSEAKAAKKKRKAAKRAAKEIKRQKKRLNKRNS
jgi:hypothetical protein